MKKCTHKRVYDGRMTFPETDAPLTTDVTFDEMVDDNHHNAPNPLQPLGIGMVSMFPLDYMHLICLGVMKRLLWLWTKGPYLQIRLGTNMK